MVPGKLSENDFSEALENIVFHKNASPPQALLPLIRRFWDSPDLALTTSTLDIADTPQLPPRFVEAVSSYRDDGPEFLLRNYPDFAMAVVLTKIWLTKIRDSQLQRTVFRTPKKRDLCRWVEILLPVARYLEPAFDPTAKNKGHPEILDCLKDVHWVEPWVGKADLAQSIADYIADKGYIPRNTYQGWRSAGVKRLYLAVQAVIGSASMTTTNIVETLSSMGSIEDSEAHDSLPFTMTEAARVSTTPVTKTPPLISLPPLPRLCIERQQQPEIIAALLNGQHRAFILYGGAGMGKSLLAGQVLRAPEVQAAFPGGIAWAAGNISVEEIAAAWCTALNLRRSPNTTWTQCWRQGGRTVGRTLLVLDDVVNLSDAAVLVDGFGPDAVVLLTTQFGAETWEALAHSWLEPEAIWRAQIGAFTPTEARTLVEQSQRRALTAEEWEIVELIGTRTGWEPTQLAQVASQTGLDAWLYMLNEMETDDLPTMPWEQAALQWKRLGGSDLQQWLIQLARYMLTPSHFGLLYAAGGAWRVTPDLAFHRLEQLEQAGLVERVQSTISEKEETALWRIRPSILSQFWRPRHHLLHRLFIQWHYPRISRSIAQVTQDDWLPWPLNVFVGMPITLLATPVYLLRVLYAKLKTPPKHQAAPSKTDLSMEYLISTDATTVVAVQLLCGLLAPVVFLFVAAALLPLLPLTPFQQARIADSIWFKPQTWIIFGLGWFLLHMGRLSWTLD